MQFHREDGNDSRLKVRNGFWDEEGGGVEGNIWRWRKDLCDFKLRSSKLLSAPTTDLKI